MSAAPPPEPHTSALLTPTARRIVIAGMMGGVSLAAIDQMVLSTAVAAISGELGDIGQAPWIFSANLLTSASSMPIWGKLGDLYGRRRVFQLAITLFIVASLLAATADSMLELIVCRALQGLGGGALLTMPYAILGDIVPPRDRAAYVAFISVVWTGAGFIGPPLGGFFVDGPGWRWMFTMNVPAAIFAWVALQTCYRLPVQRIEHRVDFAGALLLFSAVGSLILYTSWAGEHFGWASTEAIAILFASLLFFVGFVVQERRAAEPILELSLLTRRTVWPPLLATCIFGFANFSVAFFLPLFAIVVRGEDTVRAGFSLAPLTFGLLIAGIVVGRRSAATQQYRRFASLGLLIYVVGLASLMVGDAGTPAALFYASSLLLGIGSGSLSPVVVSAIQNAVEERYLGVASSLPGFARAVAQTVGTSVLGSLLAIRIGTRLRSDVAPLSPPGTDLNRFVDSPDAVRVLDGPLLDAVVEAYRAAFSDTYAVMIGVMLLAFCVTRLMRDPKLSVDA